MISQSYFLTEPSTGLLLPLPLLLLSGTARSWRLLWTGVRGKMDPMKMTGRVQGTKSKGAGRGFTLIELVMVIVIVGIMAIVAVFLFSFFKYKKWL